jgi:uncharacterized sulfatase
VKIKIIVTIIIVVILIGGGIWGIGIFLNRKQLLIRDSDSQKPNVIWLIAEDISIDLGCYGNDLIHTPNIDRLAREGVLFTNAYVSAPVSSPNRSAFITGMYQTSIGGHNQRSHRNDGYTPPTPVQLITKYFRDAGYYTSNCEGINWSESGKYDYNFDIWSMEEKPFDGTDWQNRYAGQPFYAQVNFKETHRVFIKDTSNPVDPSKVELPPYYPDHPLAKQDWANYLECIQVLDRKVGKVLNRLKKEGVADNTIVFFFGDNGRPFPRGKQFLYEGGIHVPLIIRWPGHIKPGKIADILVSTIDLASTSLSLAGIEVPNHMQGQVFLGKDVKEKEYVFAARDRVDEAVDRIRCVRTKRFKYIRNFYPDTPYLQFHGYVWRTHPMRALLELLHNQDKLTREEEKFMALNRPEEELYDLKKDPHELNNLAKVQEYQKTLMELRKVLDNWIVRTNDQGRYPESDSFISRIKKEKREKYERYMRDKGLSPDVTPEEYVEWWEEKLLKQVE